MIMVHHIQIHGLFSFLYGTPLWDLSDDLSSDPNHDDMQTLLPW